MFGLPSALGRRTGSHATVLRTGHAGQHPTADLGLFTGSWLLVMDFSVVVPTWNEELWLPRLLRSIAGHPSVSEILVADKGSSDRTGAIAEFFGARVVEGGTPAQARNRAGRLARSDVILFVDADAMVSDAVLSVVEHRFSDPRVLAVHFPLVPIDGSPFVRLCYRVMDVYLGALARLGIPQGVGTFLAIRRRTFLMVGGYREDILAGEDADFVRRVGRLGRVEYDRQHAVLTSQRRFMLERPLTFAAKTAMWAVLRLIGSGWTIVPYRWSVYPSSIGWRDAKSFGDTDEISAVLEAVSRG